MMDLNELVKEKVYFQIFKKNELYYKTESGFKFKVPVEAVGEVLKVEDDARVFEQYIRKEFELINNKTGY